MEFGIVGLGRMGGRLAEQAVERGHRVVGFERDADRRQAFAAMDVHPVATIEEFGETLERPRTVFLYVPHGDPVEQVLGSLTHILEKGDVVVDGGNSHWRESMRHHDELAAQGIRFLDVGTSGGLEGARHGACFMVGGPRDAFEHVRPLLQDLAVPEGVAYVGPPGAGHFVKLVHNAIEFGMVQAIAEGTDLLVRSEYELDLAEVFHNWSHGSVIRSWLVELMEGCLRERDLDSVGSYVEDTREVRWAIEFALEKEVWVPTIALAELALYKYRDLTNTTGKAVSLMRHAFGGHPLHEAERGVRR